jgi:Zn-finger nucleic acid-binding protein
MYMKCPVCGTHMHRRNFMRASGVIMDECRKDGVWLDCDELGKIGDYISSGGLEHSRKIVKREEEQTRRIPMEPVNYATVGLQTQPVAGEDMLSSVLLFINDLLD